MTESSGGPNLPKDQGKSGERKLPTIPELTRKVQLFIKSGWGRFLVERRWPLALIIAFVAAVFVSPHITLPTRSYQLGQYADRTIKVPREMEVPDTVTTNKRREEAAVAVRPVYDFTPAKKKEAEAKVIEAFSEAQKFFKKFFPEDQGDNDGKTAIVKIGDTSQVQALEAKFQQTLGITLDSNVLGRLYEYSYSRALMNLTKRRVGNIMSLKIVADKSLRLSALMAEDKEQGKGITMVNLEDDRETLLLDLKDIWDIKEVLSAFDQSETGQGTPEEKLASTIAKAMVQPNLTFNSAKTELRKQAARDAVAPSVYKYKKNQLIVAEGEEITQKILDDLERMSQEHKRGEGLLAFISIAAFSFIFLITVFYFAETNISKFRPNPRDLIFLSAFICFVLFMVEICMVVIEAVSNQFEGATPSMLALAVPMAAGGMIVRFLLNSEVSIIFALVVSTFAGLIIDPTLLMVIYYFTSCLVGAHFVGKASQRQTILKAGLYTAFFNIFVYLTLRAALYSSMDIIRADIFIYILFAFVGGIFSGLVVLSLTPIIEWAFGYTSDIKLLELASLNHPLLSQMVVQAPGTYNHSTLVSSLAEGAAESIGCNPLLAKVGALFHDIGKINKPNYFFENLRGGEDNKHDDLFPRMSGLILTSHVKEGVEMARRHGLGDPIADIIQQHHGTSLIYYFYQRAKEQEDPSLSTVEESDYRYPGPRPQTREAAIVMLSDIAEASTRSLANKTPARVEKNVEEMIERAFTDGQLDDCNLTLKDLQSIARSFTVILNGVYHSRIQYTDEDLEEDEGGEDNGQGQAGNSEGPANGHSQDGPRDF